LEAKVTAKVWSKDFEKPIYEMWKASKEYSFKEDSDKPAYSIDTPPPYVNAPIHIGQATTYILMDMFARFHRMLGYNVLFPLGLDRNGLPIEVAAEKKFKVKFSEIEREKFLELCRQVLEESSLASTETFLRSGVSFCSWEFGSKIGDAYMTDSPEYRALTQATFIDMWNKGLIYEDERTNNYCPGCKTTIADAEVEYEEHPTTFNDVVFKVKETGEEIIIATTRPELLGSCGMVIYNPDDSRYQNLNGKHAITPIYNKEVLIMPHPYADPEKGTGLVMMCSFGDLGDIRFFREMKLAPVFLIDADGRLNQNAGPIAGLYVKKGREKIIEMLTDAGLLKKQQQLAHRTPICERSKNPIEFIAMKEFYVKQLDYGEKLLEMAEQLNFFSSDSRKILKDWIEGLSIDWPISRRRYYATEVPLWYCEKCSQTIVPQKGKYYQPWREAPPIKTCPKCGHDTFRGEGRVFDTWFDSSITPLYILGYGRNEKFFNSQKYCTLRPQGKEIVRTWLYYTLLKCYHLTGKQIFRDAWINYHIVDGKGEKMSKSLGNVVDPQKVLDQYGAEPLRFWAAAEGNLTEQDFRCSFDRIAASGKTIVKLWNVAKFVSMFPEPEANQKIPLTPTDKWIIEELNALVESTRHDYENYDFHNPVIRIRHFIWETFASHYLEMVKNRAYNAEGAFTQDEQAAALYTLHHVLRTVLKLLAPVIPFVTYSLHNDIYERDVHKETFPEPGERFEAKFNSSELEELNSIIWKAKKDKGMSLKDGLTEVVMRENLAEIEKDFKAMHKIKKVSYGPEVKVIF
jgi:valyl-tRNA synthetase